MSDYIHRAGRVGRVNSAQPGHVTSYVTHPAHIDLVWKIEVKTYPLILVTLFYCLKNWGENLSIYSCNIVLLSGRLRWNLSIDSCNINLIKTYLFKVDCKASFPNLYNSRWNPSHFLNEFLRGERSQTFPYMLSAKQGSIWYHFITSLVLCGQGTHNLPLTGRML